ncbi:hypothetical protein BDN67DRAFT_901808 [Paxillus ammoniavirescens]|nr:hypothetical protein BDN67DRAFT_901808 [Paxillus ammoniavirescens]
MLSLRSYSFHSCFPHVVNLACKAVLKAVTNLDFAKEDAADHIPTGPHAQTILDTIERDPIASVHSLVRGIHASLLRRQYFAAVLKSLELKELQLLQDIDIKWSSTLLMIEQALILREAIKRLLSSNEFPELQKYNLSGTEWEALELFRNILVVPHAFQQRLSPEKTPTLSYAILSFRAMMVAWEKQIDDIPELEGIIQSGLDKLDSYKGCMDSVPAYVLAMGKCHHWLTSWLYIIVISLPAINPAVKLDWYSEHAPEKVAQMKELFVKEVHVCSFNSKHV